MSKGAVAKRYQPYRKLAEAEALELHELQSAAAELGVALRELFTYCDPPDVREAYDHLMALLPARE